MKNIFKISILLFIFLLITISSVNALDINMNLQSNTVNNETAEEENTLQNASDENTLSDNNISENENATTDENSNSPNTSTSNSPRVTSTTSDDDEFLTVENVLSIIVIVIGVLLVFLAVAILVRFK